MNFHDRSQVEELLSNFKIIDLEEKDEDSQIADGTHKHWHLFHIVARKV